MEGDLGLIGMLLIIIGIWLFIKSKSRIERAVSKGPLSMFGSVTFTTSSRAKADYWGGNLGAVIGILIFIIGIVLIIVETAGGR